MHNFLKPLSLFVTMLSVCSVQAEPLLFQNSQDYSSKNIEIFLQRFTQTPHPMGSAALYKLANDINSSLSQFGLETSLQEFKSFIPDLKAENPYKKNTIAAKGYNIVAQIKGESKCAIILSGHYDTKYFRDQVFVGANDGGSSTALLMELARVAKKTSFKKNSLGACTLYFVFFDGEEAVLPNWNDGKQLLNIQDNLYGSRAFVKRNLQQKNSRTYIEGNEILLLFVLDMVGHKNQNLYITSGSDAMFAQEFIDAKQNIHINQSPIYIEDDHIPFIRYNIPFLHIIDWSNLQEWHKIQDDLNIISYENIKKLGENILGFLSDVKMKDK